MAHARIIQQQMLDWIGNSIALRSALPTDAQIVDRFNLPGVESARSLLADLADAGEITIKGFGPSRTITMGRNARSFEAAPRPTPAVVARIGGKRADDEKVQIDTTAARIRAIVARGKAAVAEPAAAVIPAPVSDPVAVEVVPVPPPETPVVVEQLEVAPVPPEQQTQLQIERLPTAPGRAPTRHETAIAPRDTRRQLNIHFPHDQFDKLTALANGAGSSAAAFARATLISCLDRKPRVPAAVTAAALREKAPVVDFAHRMMALGLAAYDHERSGGAA
ncbi:hypothetical protein [Sphingomonas sp. CARO-RG-8B-R24-01]|uniref:hypothetical protein n=1 Tax=Sphingomonas sp. CARO-RG-8B-R24-01 TaxID=2914831 RepID=UPI001F57B0F6|nr:hypothetical protein [Sphingomonas sp. CARO-RG-8B-R24-01]